MKEEETPLWRCPECDNGYSWTDGLRYLTKDHGCTCPDMPLIIAYRRQTVGKDRLLQKFWN